MIAVGLDFRAWLDHYRDAANRWTRISRAPCDSAEAGQPTARYRRQRSGTPFNSRSPASSKVRPEPEPDP